jgi:hypothetical protein
MGWRLSKPRLSSEEANGEDLGYRSSLAAVDSSHCDHHDGVSSRRFDARLSICSSNVLSASRTNFGASVNESWIILAFWDRAIA